MELLNIDTNSKCSRNGICCNYDASVDTEPDIFLDLKSVNLI